MPPFDTYTDLLSHIDSKGHTPQILGHTPAQQPLITVKSGGDKLPAIFISAGSHATEQAGVSAAIELIDQLETDHQVYTFPCRDPIGLNGFAYALSLSLGETPALQSLNDLAPLLHERGEVVHEANDTVVAIIGEWAYATHNIYYNTKGDEDWLAALKGRRLYWPNRDPGIEGTDLMQRAYALIIDPSGEVLHINRFHDTPWAPAEARCTRDLMAAINPGLTLDLHEYSGDAFWFSARHQINDDDQQLEKSMAERMIAAINDANTPLPPDEFLPGSFFTKSHLGVYWLDAKKRGEGLNLVDYAAALYGPSFTIETGMQLPFVDRVAAAKLAAQKAVEVFGERHAQ